MCYWNVIEIRLIDLTSLYTRGFLFLYDAFIKEREIETFVFSETCSKDCLDVYVQSERKITSL
jgi:hypothetical protein